MTHDPRCSAPSTEEVLRGCREAVDRVGWHCVGVFQGRTDPPFNYTTGLWKTHAHPELMICGIDPERGYGAISAAVTLIERGARLTPGEDVAEVLVGYPVRFRDVDPFGCRLSFTVSNLFYDGWEVSRLQLLFPDKHGRFPGDPRCSPAIARGQYIGRGDCR
jgi:hypothetical protein